MASSHKQNNRISDLFPILINEWDYEKNGTLLPENVSVGSGRKVWWKCDKGHSWQATVNNRVGNGSNCPYCVGKRVIIGENDLKTTRPELILEWDYEKNGALLPENVPTYSSRKVWWKCAKGHSWQASIANRTSLSSNCPYCSGKRAIIGENDLKTTHPELLSKWDYEKNGTLLPENVSAGSNKKVWWKCAKGHSWQAPIVREIQGHGCPLCSKHLQKSFPETALYFFISKSFEDTIQTYKCAELGKSEFDIFIPSKKIAIEYDGIVYHSAEHSRAREKNKYQIAKSMGVTLVRIREMEAHSEDCDHLIMSNLDHLTRNSSEYNDDLVRIINAALELLEVNKRITRTELESNTFSILKLLNAEAKESELPERLLEEWDYQKNDPLLPKMLSKGSHQKVWWKCEKGHSWQATVKERVGSSSHKGTNCPICSNNRIVIGDNDLFSNKPRLMGEWDFQKNCDIDPRSLSVHSEKKVWWKCAKGHSWQASINSRVKGCGCPYCSNRALLKGFNDLLTTNPRIISEWDFDKNTISPSEIICGSNQKVWWKCEKGHSWQASPKSRLGSKKRKGTGCPFCSNRALLIGYNDLASQRPELLYYWDNTANKDLNPYEIIFTSQKRIWWKCPHCNYIWESAIWHTRAYNCPKCKSK